MSTDPAPSARFRANEPNVIFEAFEDETVLINLESGNYYSFSGSGAFIWSAVTKGQTIPSVTSELGALFASQQGEIEESVPAFVNQLIDESLIVERNALAQQDEVAEAVPAGPAVKQFERPSLHKYSDMQELLLLDPIHEVDETGWPHALPPQKA